MTAPRTISPQSRPSFKLLINREELPRSVNILLIEVKTEFNKIATAKIILADGDAAAQTFAQSSSELFVPGNELEIKLGYNDEDESVFKGVLVGQKIESRGSATNLQITGKHYAYRLATTEKYKVFQDISDEDVISQLALNNGIVVTTASPTTQHENLVQYKSTDWDFMVNRAECNGQVVVCIDRDLKILLPEVQETPDLALQFGATMLGFEAELDGRQQEENLSAFGWSYQDQEKTSAISFLGDLATAGNLASPNIGNRLLLVEENSFYTAVSSQEELDALAAAEQKRRRLSKIRATITIAGNASCIPGSTVQLNGLGDRFNGNALVSGVLHTFKTGVWKTMLQVGMDPKPHLEKFEPTPKSNLAIPRGYGLEIGRVIDLNDPRGEFRVQVFLPTLGDQTGIWARMAQPDAGNERTVFFKPEVGDEVIVGFLNDDPRAPIILGALHSSANPSPVAQSADNHIKGIITRSGMKLLFDDEKSILNIETPNGNKIMLSDEDGAILIEDENRNTVKLNSDGIAIESASSINIKASTDVTIEGVNVNIKASAQLKAEGGAGAEISSSAVTKVTGSIVQLN